jgi:glyoxylase-like metal-dependent hydrolase (beta-lactamase superfamily II)
VVRGGDELLLVDTRSSHRQADQIRDDLQVFGAATIRAVVNTHAHFDHSFGNGRFGPDSDLDLPIYGHRLVAAHHDRYERPMLADWIERGEEPIDEWREVVITSPTHLVNDGGATLDIGGRRVDLHYFGRGHTDNDLLVQVPDANVWLVGDLVEESGPPMYGSGSYPLAWPATVQRLLHFADRDVIVVPGHGAPVDHAFVTEQQAALAAVAALIRELHSAGVPAESAVEAGADRWPFPAVGMTNAVRDGYAQLNARST